MGFKRNLTTSEILSQIYYFARLGKVSNLVFMGMGEPFLNYDNVLRAIAILNDELGLNIAARKMVISTIGIVAGIQEISQETKQLRLAWSLVAPNDHLREKLIAYRGLPSLAATLAAFKAYQKKTRRRITLEYVLLKGVNDGEEALRGLLDVSRQLDSHINLIPFNPAPNLPFRCGEVFSAHALLKQWGANVTVRKSFGGEIQAACGQLAGSAPPTFFSTP
jgi:23S rRNA (adenine2503-C2)-methyltransferase